MAEPKKRARTLWGVLGGGLAATVVGLLLLCSPLGDSLARLSYDLPFAFRSEIPDEIIMINLDQDVKSRLGAPLDQPLARPYHTRLLQRLKQDKPRLIFYDIIFDEPDRDPALDLQLGAAIQDTSLVVLIGYSEQENSGSIFTDSVFPPIPALKDKAAGWGLSSIWNPNGMVREINTGTEDYPSASWVAARLLNASCVKDERQRLRKRWLNYYGPPNLFSSVNFDQALDPQGPPPGYFSNKIVVVGASPTMGLVGAGREDFGTPYSRFGRRFSSGAEIHALSLLNLLRGDWLEEMPHPFQIASVILLGFGLGSGLMFARPWHAAWLGAVAAFLIFAISVLMALNGRIWWPWLISAAAQTSIAFAWSVGWQYSIERRKRKKLRQAFAGYLSPHLADRIALEDFDLSPGGKVVEATVMFTDLEGFTSLSENLDPKEVSLLLTSYFNLTTREILEQEGTIIKYMGDAVMAVWGAPLIDPRQAERAVLAGLGMIQSSRVEIAGKRLRTRVGIHSGHALAGNLGSDFRFDYTLIGDTTNTAFRLENLNKLLATEILISEATRIQLSDRIHTRLLGQFLLAGKTQPVTLYEVLSSAQNHEPPPAWVQLFEDALRNFVEQKLDLAETHFRRAIEIRGHQDGPSGFYLEQIAQLKSPPSSLAAWDGIVRITSK